MLKCTTKETVRCSGPDDRHAKGSLGLCPQVALEVPGWFRAIPLGALERTGCSVMQRVLDRMVPRFLGQLQADYALWAAGDESRKPIGAGEL